MQLLGSIQSWSTLRHLSPAQLWSPELPSRSISCDIPFIRQPWQVITSPCEPTGGTLPQGRPHDQRGAAYHRLFLELRSMGFKDVSCFSNNNLSFSNHDFHWVWQQLCKAVVSNTCGTVACTASCPCRCLAFGHGAHLRWSYRLRLSFSNCLRAAVWLANDMASLTSCWQGAAVLGDRKSVV